MRRFLFCKKFLNSCEEHYTCKTPRNKVGTDEGGKVKPNKNSNYTKDYADEAIFPKYQPVFCVDYKSHNCYWDKEDEIYALCFKLRNSRKCSEIYEENKSTAKTHRAQNCRQKRNYKYYG